MNENEKQLVYNLIQLYTNKVHHTHELYKQKDSIRISLNNDYDDSNFEISCQMYIHCKEKIADIDFHINKIKNELGII